MPVHTVADRNGQKPRIHADEHGMGVVAAAGQPAGVRGVSRRTAESHGATIPACRVLWALTAEQQFGAAFRTDGTTREVT